MNPAMFLFGLTLFLLHPAPQASAQRLVPRPTNAAAGLTIAVADFTGKDQELGRFIAETLLTDLAQSDKLQLVERAELRRAITELKLQSTGLTEPHEVKRLGKVVGVDHLIVGSYLVYGDQIIINARLLDVRSGRLVPGGAAHIGGSSHDILSVTHRLARLFHQHVTGADLVHVDDPDADHGSPEADHGSDTHTPPSDHGQDAAIDQPESLPQNALIPAKARPNDVLRERDLAALVSHIMRQIDSQTDSPLTTVQPAAPVTRLRALTALVKLAVAPENVAAYRDTLPDRMPPDAAQIPAWGRPYVAAAVEQGWWPADRPLRAREMATWAFVGAILEQMPLTESAPPPARRTADLPKDDEPDPDAVTGLIVDAHDLPVQRTMSLRILDEDGRVLYPDPKYLPGFDFLEDHGMCAYCEAARDARRAGGRPLIVRAIDVAGPGRDDLVVSNRTAERIQEANRSGRFLRRWAVCVLIDSR